MDTTTATIIWSLLLLGHYSEHQEKVHEELDEIFSDSDVLVNTSKLSQLQYLDRVIKETLRLYPSVPLITRNLTEDMQLGTLRMKTDKLHLIGNMKTLTLQ